MTGSERRRWVELAASSDTDECIEWPFPLDSRRYGRITVAGRRLLVTHLVLSFSGCQRPAYGAVHDACALHSCDNPPCCNPRHLRWGSQAENMADRKRRNPYAVGSEHPRSKLTEADVREIRRLRAAGHTYRDIADRVGTTHMNVAQIVSGRSWRHVA